MYMSYVLDFLIGKFFLYFILILLKMSCWHKLTAKIKDQSTFSFKIRRYITNLFRIVDYERGSICNEIAVIAPPTHRLEVYTIYGMKDRGFTFRMVHHSYLSSYIL